MQVFFFLKSNYNSDVALKSQYIIFLHLSCQRDGDFFGFFIIDVYWYFVIRLGKSMKEIAETERDQTKRIVYSVMYGVGMYKGYLIDT